MKTYIDLFSGIGGARLAAEPEGFECLLSVEWDAGCADVQQRNFGCRPLVTDIRHVTDARVPLADLVVATPPCQSYSMVGSRDGFGDPRAWVWWDVLRVLRASGARVLLMENVPGLVQHDGQKTIGSMAEYLRLAGFRTRWRIIDASEAGAAQHRPRLYIVASRFDLPPFDFGRVPRYAPGCVVRLLTPGSHAWLDPAKYTLIDPPICQPSGMVFAGHLKKPLRQPGRDPRMSSAHRDQYRIYDARGLHPALRSARWCWPCSPVRIGDQVRRLVPRELLRLQGFPDGFTFPRRGLLHQQVGNAVYVPLVRLLLCEVRTQLFS